MRGNPKKIHYETVQELCSAIKQLQGDYRYQDRLKLIISSALGTVDDHGLLTPRIQYYFANSPLAWAAEYDQLVALFNPTGEILSKIIATPDMLMPLEVKLLPKNIIAQFPERGSYESRIIPGLRRQMGGNYYMPVWEWFWANIASALLSMSQIQERRELCEQEKEDELYYQLSRNLYLAIIRKGLKNNKGSSQLADRLTGLLEAYLIQELFFKLRSSQKRIQVKYKLKSHYLGLFFLLVQSKQDRTGFNEDSVATYQDFMLKLTENYSAVSTNTSNLNIRFLLRVWPYLVTRQTSLDGYIITQLERANQNDGWFRLGRCPQDKWVNAINKTQVPAKELSNVLSIRSNIYRLLRKYNEWTPNFGFLAVLEQFLLFDEKVLRKYIKGSSKKQEQESIAKCFERLLNKLSESGMLAEVVETHKKRLNNLYLQLFEKSLTVKVEFKSQDAERNLSRTSRQQLQSISYQNPRLRNVWEHPLQNNEYYILFKVMFWIAEKLDHLIPGKRVYPCLNLRIFSNPYVFVLGVILIFAILKIAF